MIAQIFTLIFHILLALIVLLLMVTIHELGHYLAGKIFKFKINEFAVGLGPKLLSKKLKSGEEFSLRALPLGGYCAFKDEDEEDEGEADKQVELGRQSGDGSSGADGEVSDGKAAKSAADGQIGGSRLDAADNGAAKQLNFSQQKPWKRIIVFFAGAGFNIVSAVIFSFIFLLAVGYSVPVVGATYIHPDTGHYYNNLRPGDEVIAVNGRRITPLRSYNSMMEDIGADERFILTIIREGNEYNVTARRQRIESRLIISPQHPDGRWYFDVVTGYNEDGSRIVEQWPILSGAPGVTHFTGIGLNFAQEGGARSLHAGRALLYCVPFTGEIAGSIFRVFGMMFAGEIPVSEVVAGPVGAVSTMTQLTMMSMRNVLFLMAFLAINFAIFNLLPIPALDGSKIVFAIIEWIRGKPINRKIENAIHVIGFMTVVGLMLLIVTPMDIIRLIRR